MTAVPIPPGDAPMMPVGLRANEFFPHGRDAQSMAFFSAPGIDRLYSGETISRPSDASMSSLRDVGVVIRAVQREILERDLGELEALRCQAEERLGERPVDRVTGEASDEVADPVRRHGGTYPPDRPAIRRWER